MDTIEELRLDHERATRALEVLSKIREFYREIQRPLRKRDTRRASSHATEVFKSLIGTNEFDRVMITEYMTFTDEDSYSPGGSDPYTYWLHTTVTIKVEYIIIRGRYILLSVEWYRVEHKSRSTDGDYWYPFEMNSILEITRNSQIIWSYTTGEYLPEWYIVKYPGISAQSGDMFHDFGYNLICTLHTTITIAV